MAFRGLYDIQQYGVPQTPNMNRTGIPMQRQMPSAPVPNSNLQLRTKPTGVERGGVLTHIPGQQITPAAPQYPTAKLEVSPFLTNMYKSMQNIDPELRADYVQNAMGTIKARLDKYEFRMARGLPLTPEQQAQYNNLQSSYNDLQKYINDPSLYDKHFGAVTMQEASPTPQVGTVFLRTPGRIW